MNEMCKFCNQALRLNKPIGLNNCIPCNVYYVISYGELVQQIYNLYHDKYMDVVMDLEFNETRVWLKHPERCIAFPGVSPDTTPQNVVALANKLMSLLVFL
jgi:hypothetical protein